MTRRLIPWKRGLTRYAETIPPATASQYAGMPDDMHHGYSALEGTFLGGCLFSARTVGRSLACAL